MWGRTLLVAVRVWLNTEACLHPITVSSHPPAASKVLTLTYLPEIHTPISLCCFLIDMYIYIYIYTHKYLYCFYFLLSALHHATLSSPAVFISLTNIGLILHSDNNNNNFIFQSAPSHTNTCERAHTYTHIITFSLIFLLPAFVSRGRHTELSHRLL